jgi:hypothetical protein
MDSLLTWIEYLTKPQDRIGGMPICPFAKKAMKYDMVEIINVKRSVYGLLRHVVSVIKKWDSEKELYVLVDSSHNAYGDLRQIQSMLNSKYLEFTFLLGHPDRPFSINGVVTTFSESPIFFIQKKTDINRAQVSLLKTEYYEFWTKEQLDNIVNWRK